ncbi:MULTISPECIES: fasciclin domain-containing protein [Streptomyces]|uniref:Fasciclin n=1 Tax=Streptomyces tsukubensis (strain DSM 42081 / NBRC 108919 / NRRL 18488 / 9993) TaxID=1114943 RepID=A0A7G3UD19_STRT9|nr:MULTISPECIES: fasciclin domain-containing protein [Streptomyces]AZK97000.1 fasciclin [Streptomyces tsukubensis]MYS66564.1 fasciclin domain-containing protein [Streptomyces sp. SID5473]QKM67020.1 fasciclin [Streptomyces tsukubensis NRRL18488]TAI41501.1 fasciclin domain-containing protein [Streptomyces tsukubensis]
MIRMRAARTATAVAAAVLLPLVLAGCSDSGSDTKAASTPASEEAAEADKAPASDAMTPGQPFGPACAGVPKEGAGSFDGMAKDPVATAASNNPALSTLVAAVKQAGLVDTLNNARGITVFAPTNDAFAKIPKADLDKVLADKKLLTDILTYHVVGRNLTPEQLANGSFETLQKGAVTTSGSGESYRVNDSASVVCGNVGTSNATVYIVDTVLMPQ